jgi:hypothetical protein
MPHRISLLLVAAFLAASCSNTDARHDLTQPTSFGGALSSVSVSASPPMAVAQPVSNPFCPSVAPFTLPLVVVVQPNDALDVVVTTIRLQFFDITGNAMPRVTLPAPVPTTQFGIDLANARSAQTFPVDVGIGCETGHTGNVRIAVETRDGQGRTGSAQTTVSVR